MIKKIILSFLVLLPCLCSAKILTNKQIELFEVGGVKLGMKESQVVKALTHKYNVSESKLKLTNFSGELREISLEISQDQKIKVTFENDISINPPVRVVDSISYTVPNTPNNEKQLLESAVKRYGKPTIGGDIDITNWHQWCQLMPKKAQLQIPTCDNKTAIFSIVLGNTISLSTPKYKEAIKEFELRQKNTKPNF